MGGDYKEIAISEGRVRPEGGGEPESIEISRGWDQREERCRVWVGPERREISRGWDQREERCRVGVGPERREM
jgi:hypothetical protein